MKFRAIFHAMLSKIMGKVCAQKYRKYRAIFQKAKWKITLAKIRGNKKELEQYKSIAAIDITSNHTAGRSMSECPIPVIIRLETIFYEKTFNLNLKKYRKVADLFIFKLT